jgi:hypothetical protein
MGVLHFLLLLVSNYPIITLKIIAARFEIMYFGNESDDGNKPKHNARNDQFY